MRVGITRVLRNPLAGPVPAAPDGSAPWWFHRALPSYAATPLIEAPGVAAALGVGRALVKDESSRLGMPSFKILGASWAAQRALCAHTGVDVDPARGLDGLKAVLAGHRPLELVAATDGNHGHAVAHMARRLQLDAHIFVPGDMVAARIAAIRREGARVTVVAGSYDDAVERSAAEADARHLVISDTSWPGYEDVPAWVIDGYATIGIEVDAQLAELGVRRPDVVAVQIGVGAFASALVRHFRPQGSMLVGVEPTRADCVLSSVEAGGMTRIPEPHDSIMAGLNCGTPSLIAWPTVSAGLDWLVAVEDDAAREAMRMLAADGIVSGESGAAGLAGLLEGGTAIGLRASDVVLLISTEGATDPAGYAEIVGQAPAART